MRWIKLTIPPSSTPQRLDAALATAASQQLGHPEAISRKQAKRFIESGQARVNDQACTMASYKLQPEDTLEIEASALNVQPTTSAPAPPKPTQALPAGPIPTMELSDEQLIYEDAWLCAVNKPPGLPSHQTRDARRDHLVAALTRCLMRRDGEAPYLALHHRLDLETSGVIVFARQRAANAALMESFQSHTAQKTYLALVEDPQRKLDAGLSWEVEDHLSYDAQQQRMIATRAGGDWAKTTLRCLSSAAGAALVMAMPHTGRRHQIRAHLASSGHPILGDLDYGAAPGAAPRVMLHALALSLPSPADPGQRLTLRAPLYEDMQREISARGLTLPQDLLIQG